jgi:hypothetical protein
MRPDGAELVYDRCAHGFDCLPFIMPFLKLDLASHNINLGRDPFDA